MPSKLKSYVSVLRNTQAKKIQHNLDLIEVNIFVRPSQLYEPIKLIAISVNSKRMIRELEYRDFNANVDTRKLQFFYNKNFFLRKEK